MKPFIYVSSKYPDFDPYKQPILEWAHKENEPPLPRYPFHLQVQEWITPGMIKSLLKNDNLIHYAHKSFWSNRLIHGDSYDIMNTLIKKERKKRRIQMVYFNFPLTNNKFKKFNVTEYLSYFRDRLKLARTLLNETGSCFVQCSDKYLHHFREIMDEIFQASNFVTIITFLSKNRDEESKNPAAYRYIIWYARNFNQIKYNQLYLPRELEKILKNYDHIQTKDGEIKSLKNTEGSSLIPDGRFLKIAQLKKHHQEHLEELKKIGRIYTSSKEKQYFIRYETDFPYTPITNIWEDIQEDQDEEPTDESDEATPPLVFERCLLMTTDIGDLIFNPLCGSGNTAIISEKCRRRWICCDDNINFIECAKSRLMTELFHSYKLGKPDNGFDADFSYKITSRIQIIKGKEQKKEVRIISEPIIEKENSRVSGPFTVETVPKPEIISISELAANFQQDQAAGRIGHSLWISDMLDYLRTFGILDFANKKIEFSRVELINRKYLQAEAETTENPPHKVAIAFGSQCVPLDEQKAKEILQEAEDIRDLQILILIAHEISEKTKDLLKSKEGLGYRIIWREVSELFKENDYYLEKSRMKSNLFLAQPDANLRKNPKSAMYTLEIQGFDIINIETGKVESHPHKDIILTEIDTNYDGQNFVPRQLLIGETSESLEIFTPYRVSSTIKIVTGYHSEPFSVKDRESVAMKIIDKNNRVMFRVWNLKED